MITSARSKSSNSSGFNPVLQKFYEMICEIIFSKTVWGIFFIFCRSNLQFHEQFHGEGQFSEPNITESWISPRYPFILTKFPHTVLKILSVQMSWKNLFLNFFLLRTWSFLHDCKTTNLGVTFFNRKLILYIFCKGDYLILI